MFSIGDRVTTADGRCGTVRRLRERDDGSVVAGVRIDGEGAREYIDVTELSAGGSLPAADEHDDGASEVKDDQ